MQIFKEPQWIFRKKKKSHVKLNVYNFSLMGMWWDPIAIKLRKRNAPSNEKTRYSFCRIIGKDNVFLL
ncbi:hypothetical protein COA21_23345 [Bacillus cereus]|nr:hypothetical protein COJ89_12595 [Bacillus cereus]PGQ65084.1 hypothetical protein COA21_23345 [Bacillus cereus]